MNDQEWLNGLRAGDEVAVDPGCSHRPYSLTRVERVTATQIVIGNARFRRKDGREVGDVSGWYSTRLTQPTDEIRMAIQRERALALLRGARWEELDTATLVQCSRDVRRALRAKASAPVFDRQEAEQ